MSDFEDSTVTYTTVSSPYEGRSGDVSPGVDGPPVMLEDPYAYVVAAFQTLPPPDYLLSSDRRADRPEVTLPPRKRLSIVHCLRYEAGESSVAAAARPIEGRKADYGFVNSVEAEIRRWRAEDIGYGIRDTWIDPRDVAEEEVLTTLEGVNTREARCSREAWAHSIGLSSAVYFELQGYMTHTWVQDQRIDAQDTLIATLTTQLSSLQGHLATTLGEIQALHAREQARAGAPEGASSST
nr:hypothetical protein [Tanacetum cinerariifolium]